MAPSVTPPAVSSTCWTQSHEVDLTSSLNPRISKMWSEVNLTFTLLVSDANSNPNKKPVLTVSVKYNTTNFMHFRPVRMFIFLFLSCKIFLMIAVGDLVSHASPAKISSFSSSLWENLFKRLVPPEGLAPLSGRSWICHWIVKFSLYLTFHQCLSQLINIDQDTKYHTWNTVGILKEEKIISIFDDKTTSCSKSDDYALKHVLMNFITQSSFP